MSSVDKEREEIRLYLLGHLTEEERERLEEQFVTDRDYQEEVLIVEEELIEDYLGDSLSAQDKERFTAHLLATSQQRHRLEVAQALNRYCANPPTVNAPVAEGQLNDSAFGRRTIIGST